ncbi:3-hydroxyanthranilate 3,4-dioxygenase-like [Platichthys flesus]|uniref:3-hydroxyanthranilate 3,4-dioxygenase-like n=1 Tax=Platichthys flesus TaxID=8260 RepID=UPI002DBA117D|nr:3-hydroxyanthranilate 3,4-dioxygenase-like [Platichthys flesus]
MFVGGPNSRKDCHIEDGEELFYQLKGDMCLKVIENGKHKDVHIREGEMFLLPARIPHSPQRQANTVGLVVERRRLLTEIDCLRYHVENTTDILFEKWFYCQNLGTQLVPIIKELFSSEQCRTGKPDPDEVFRQPPFQMNTKGFEGFIVNIERFKNLKGTRRVHTCTKANTLSHHVMVFGPGLTEITVPQSDVWIWQMEGSSKVTMNEQEATLTEGDCFIIPEQSQYQWQREDRTVDLLVVQNPERKRP